MSTEFASIEQRADASTADLDDLSDNVVDDLVEYSRGEVVANEKQFVLTALSKSTACRPAKFVVRFKGSRSSGNSTRTTTVS